MASQKASPDVRDAVDFVEVREALVGWFHRGHRVLPWRSEPTPYRVWVSEIMLQQTRVETVIDYFQRFMARFPTVGDLAAAPLDDVLAHWSGLGYYSRARNLHRAAQEVVARHGGQLPRSLEALLDLPGVGRYTAGAIASIAFGLPAPIVDGNVIRVVARVFDLPDEVCLTATKAEIWSIAAQLVCDRDPSALNQGLMELGATVCVPRSPKCTSCPLASSCRARRLGTVAERPVKAARRAPVPMVLLAVVPQAPDGRAALRQREEEGLFGGLWEPLVETWPDPDTTPDERSALAWLNRAWPAGAVAVRPAAAVQHTLSHRALTVHVFAAPLLPEPALAPPPGWRLYAASDLEHLGTSRLVRKILSAVQDAPTRQGDLFR